VAFVGTFEHTLDEKGRLVLPSKFRTHFVDRVYLSPGAGCISLRTPEQFNEMVTRTREQVRAGDVQPEVLRGLASISEEVRPDGQGRITLPARLQAFASLDRDVVLCGAIDWVEIWSSSVWPDLSEAQDDAVAQAFRQGIGI